MARCRSKLVADGELGVKVGDGVVVAAATSRVVPLSAQSRARHWPRADTQPNHVA